MMRWLERWAMRRAIRDGKYTCPSCGGWVQAATFNQAVQSHIRFYCTDIDPAAAGREVVRVLRQYEKAQGR